MLTVIIFKDSSKDFINKYRTLFEPYLDSGQIAFCLWDEHGTTVQTALGNLLSIIKGVDKWRAIVALPLSANDHEIPLEQTDPENPFDYLCNSETNPPVKESLIPVIRLAQMLGGVPRPNRHFVNKWVNDNQMLVMKQEKDDFLKEQTEKWQEICDKYSFGGDAPSGLYFFAAKIKDRIKIPSTTDAERARRHEIDSSLFVERNRYPAKARFIVQECSKPGNVHYEEDLFGFWMTVLTLAINDFASGTFEAYKLYRAEAVVDKKLVHEVLSSYYNRLGGVLYCANRQIQDLSQISEEPLGDLELPFFDVSIPVQFEALAEDGLYIPSGKIGLAGNCPVQEEPWWHEAVRTSRSVIKKVLRTVGIVLDRASINSSYFSQLSAEEVRDLNEYQRNIMEEHLSEMEADILTFNTNSFLPIRQYYEESLKTEQQTSVKMRKRMTRGMTIAVAIISILVYVAGFFPDYIFQYEQGFDFLTVIGISGIGVAGMALAGIVCLLFFRKSISDGIVKHNSITENFSKTIKDSGERFSNYLSNCCTYMRGRRLLQRLEEQEQVTKDGILKLTEHVNQLEIQMKIIENWLLDFSLRPKEDNGEFANKVEFDFELRPSQNRQYLIQLEAFNLKVEGPDGSNYQAPYPFISTFDISRIPVFENDSAKRTEDSNEEGDGWT